MSTTVEHRVVEMQFNNARFEKNASTTLTTLDKLKQKLNFNGASKGLGNLATAASKVNMTGLGKGVDTVMTKFSALEVMGVTALANITNSAVNAGKRMISALTIDPIKTGFSEYETQINAIQTILANTQSKGTTLDDVNQALDTLNTYADKTIYNFTEMTRNIGTFTAAGVDLDTSVRSIQGIANLAAISGSTSQQASTAMYQLSQALASGTVKLMDWNSVVNAGMGGQVFQDALKETARVHGVAIDEMIEKNGSFRETLQEEWLTAEILNETLEKFTLTTEGLTDAQIEQNRQMLKSKGYTDEQIDGIFKLGKTATDAATKVKTFSQLWDTLKESAQSGWTQTWELIVGDFEQSKSLLTSISDYVGNIINKSSEKRNTVLRGALTSNWDKLITKINEAGVETSVFEDKLKSALKEGGHDVDKLIEKHGSLEQVFRSGAVSSDILRNAIKSLTGVTGELGEKMFDLSGIKEKLGFGSVGDDVKKVQSALEKLGYTLDKFGVDGIIGAETTAAIKKFQADSGLKADGIVGPETIAALEKAGKATSDLVGENKKLVDSYDDLVDAIEETSGREKALEALKNVVKALEQVLRTAKGAWEDIFPPKTMTESVQQLQGMIDGLLAFTEKLSMSEETAAKLTRVFKGLFAALDIVATLTRGGLSIAFKLISKIFGWTADDVLTFAANIGDAIVKVRDWIDSVLDLDTALDSIVAPLQKAVTGIKDWISGLKGSDNIGRDIVLGLVNGLVAGVGAVWDAAVALGESIVTAIKSFLGIHSPSTVMAEVGENTIAGLIQGLQNGLSGLWDGVKGIASKLVDWFKGIDFGTIFAVGVGGVSLVLLGKVAKALSILASPLEGLTGLFESLSSGIENVTDSLSGMFTAKGKEFKANAWKKRADAVLSFALAIGVLAVSMRLLAGMDWDTELKPALLTLAGLAVIIGVLSVAIGKLGPTEGVKLGKFALALLGVSASMLMISFALKNLAGIEHDDLVSAGNAIGQLAIVMAGFMLIAKIPTNAGKLGGTMIKLAIALGLMVGVVKLIGKLTDDEVTRATDIIGKYILFIAAVSLANLASGKYVNKIGGTMIKLGIALALMVGVVKLINKLTDDEINRAVDVIGKYLIFVGAIALLSAIPGAAKIGGSLLGVTIALTLMVGTVKLIDKLTTAEIDKATAVIGKYLLFVAAVALIGLIPGTSKIAGTLIAVSVAIGILAGVVALVGLLNQDHLDRGLKAVGTIGVIFALMALATKGAQNCVGNLVVMTIAVVVMTGCVAALATIDGDKLAGATIALGVLMGMLALIEKSGSNIQGSMSSLIVMTVVVGLLGGLIYLLSGLPVDNTLGVALGLSALLLSLSVSMAIVSKVGAMSTGAMVGMLAMTGVVALLAVVLGALTALDCAPSLETASALSVMLLAMTGVFVILGVTGGLAGTAIAGAVGLMAVVAIIGGVAVAIGALMTLIPTDKIESWKTGLENFMDFIVILATGLGEAIGGLIGGALSGVSTGINDIAACLTTLTDALNPFAESAKKLDGAALDGVTNLVSMITAITGAGVMEAITSWVTGSSTMDQFASSLGTFGDAIVAFSENVAGKINSDAVQAAADAGNIMAALQAAIPEDKWLDGKISLDDFGKKIKKFGECLVDYTEEVAGIDSASISTSLTAATILVNLAQKISAIDGDGIDNFKKVKTIGDTLSKYANKVADVDASAVATSVGNANRLISLINSMAGIDISGVKSFKSAMASLGKTNLDGFVEAFSKAGPALTAAGANMVDFLTKGLMANESSITNAASTLMAGVAESIRLKTPLFKVAGIEAVSRFINGINDHKDRAESTMDRVSSGMLNAITGHYGEFFSAGSYLVIGFANGISVNSYMAAARAREMASAAAAAARAALDEHSPSKVFYKIGAFAGKGFVNAFSDYESIAYGAGTSVARSATEGLSKTIARIGNAINSDIDSQPVIRPVLDLSAVRADASTINGMFGMRPSVGLLANVNSINSSMNRRQNGGNGDVVSAINRLQRGLANVGNTTNIINGVTYDDGSAINEAVRIIARAALIEGRV